MKQKSDVNYREMFRDIVFGYSEIEFQNKTLFIKHLSVFDQIHIDELRNKFLSAAKKRGIPTEEDYLIYLKENDIWTSQDENELKEKSKFLESLHVTKKSLYLSSEIDNINKQITDAEKNLINVRYKKLQLMTETCESYADKRVSEHYVFLSFYKEKGLINREFCEEEVDELSKNEMLELVNKYNYKYEVFNDLNIQKLTLEEFFSMYRPFCESISDFYNKSIFLLSTHQLKLIVYSRMFKSIFENYPKIPDQIKKDPDKIIDYVNAQDKAKTTLKNVDRDGASTIVGAKESDYDNLGVGANKSQSLSDMLKSHGGKMDMKDLMKAMNK